MELLALFVGSAVFFGGAKTLVKKTVPRLSCRKIDLRNYFVLGLDVDGRIADALWKNDPWLAGPYDSSEETMIAFNFEYYSICKSYRGFTTSDTVFFKCGSKSIEVDAISRQDGQFGGISYRFDDGFYEMFLSWSTDGVYCIDTDYSFQMTTTTSNHMQTRFDNFDTFRRILLDTTHAFVTGTKVRNPHEIIGLPPESSSFVVEPPVRLKMFAFLAILISLFGVIITFKN